ncbi:uncharacterized protein LOC116618984 [Nematostella vectensis]|uniref:uncharacterized protein LOC116618984 n=1 Tax=Nematostella vectensis TaxID=45351 RepID=UPI002077239D|nr:uncharacterized protein LOC116618984 [Nematostella vectensis]
MGGERDSFTAVAVELLFLLRRRRKKMGRKKTVRRSKWVRPIFMQTERENHGQFHSLLRKLEDGDSYLRMSPERFQHLHLMVGPIIAKKDTKMRKAISSEERLVVTLRYLATGDSQQSQSFNFRIGRSTVSEIIRETCSAIWEALHKNYLKSPSTPDEWQEIANDFESLWDFPHCIEAGDGKHVVMECTRCGHTQEED